MLLDEKIKPEWFTYPDEFMVLINQNLIDFTPWVILTNERLSLRFDGIQVRYPTRELIPFARREDNDDVACWELNNSIVVIIHDFASSGHEGGKEKMKFWNWLRLVVDDMIEYNE